MFQAAETVQLDPDRLSFTGCFQILKCRLPECDSSTPQSFEDWYQALLWEVQKERCHDQPFQHAAACIIMSEGNGLRLSKSPRQGCIHRHVLAPLPAPAPMPVPTLVVPGVPPSRGTPRSATFPADSDRDSAALRGGAPRRHGPWHHGIPPGRGGSGRASPGTCSRTIYPRVDHRRTGQLAHPGFRRPPGLRVRCLHCRPGSRRTQRSPPVIRHSTASSDGWIPISAKPSSASAPRS